MENITKLKELVELAESHANKLYNKNTKVAATKLRGTMQDLKKLAQTIRVEALEHVKNMPTKHRAKKGDEEDGEEEADE